jgi:glycosyltransferase involved in cell wall biosynthesis
MPTYDRAWCIERAIKSVLDQSVGDWELVIVDDGSSDGTKKKVDKYLLDKRIKYFFQQNEGVGSARNNGIKESTGEYITLLDSDDELYTGAIEQMQSDIKFFDEYQTDLIVYLSKKVDDIKYIDDAVSDFRCLSFVEAIKGDWPKVETIQLYKRELFSKESFPKEQGGLEGLFLFRLLKYHTKALLRKKTLRVYHTDHEDRLTGNNQILLRSKTMPILYKKFLDEFRADYEKSNPKALAYFYLEMGIFQTINGQKKEGRKSLLTSVRYNDSKLFMVYIIQMATYMPNKIFIGMTKLAHSFKKILK